MQHRNNSIGRGTIILFVPMGKLTPECWDWDSHPRLPEREGSLPSYCAVSASPFPRLELRTLVSVSQDSGHAGDVLGKQEVNRSPGALGLSHAAPRFTAGETEGQRARGVICPGLCSGRQGVMTSDPTAGPFPPS